MASRLIMSNVIREQEERRKVEGNGAMRQERKEMVYAFSCCVTRTMEGQWRV